MYNVKDNAESTLQVGLSSTANTVVVALGTGVNFPEAPFIAVLNKRDNNGAITKSEKVEVTAKDGDQFTINRGFEDTTPMDFNSGDYFSLFVLARHITDLNGEISTNRSSINSLATRVTTAEKNISDLQKAGSISYLSKDVYVGEYYTTANSLRLQHVPVAGNCSLGYAIGDNAARTQIHIQRIASGTPSNTLKMMFRNVGSPTATLYCEIRKVTTYSTGSEYYRTGAGELVATATASYSLVGKEWSTVTFTFDKTFGGTAGEKLCIVVRQQDNIVNATNYYEMACDATQFGEGLRLNTYNGSSYSTTKLMPYAESSGFVSYVLAKTQTAAYTGATAVVTKSVDCGGATSSGYGSVTYTPSAISVPTTLLRYKVVFSSNQRLQTSMVVGSTTQWSGNYGETKIGEVTKASGDTVTFSGYKNSGGSSSFRTDLTFYYYLSETVNIPARVDKPLVKVDSVKTAGSLINCCLFGLIGNDWWSGGYE